jgi:hypothetical protein
MVPLGTALVFSRGVPLCTFIIAHLGADVKDEYRCSVGACPRGVGLADGGMGSTYKIPSINKKHIRRGYPTGGIYWGE